MRNLKRLIKSFYQLLLPVFVLLLLASAGGAIWLVHSYAEPPRAEYLITPAKFAQLSSRGAQVTDETWENSDGTTSRGWLLRGTPGMPAVVLLHRYGGDRSHTLNLGVKLNETTDFTVLMPDLRGHGLEPAVDRSSFAGCEADDTATAIEFLKKVTVSGGKPLVGEKIGIYGVELGALSALVVAARDPSVETIVLESVPKSSTDLIASVLAEDVPYTGFITSRLVSAGTYIYFLGGCFERSISCDLAGRVAERNVMLLAGPEAAYFQTTTSDLSSCFPKSTKVRAFTDLTPTGFDLTNATLEQSDFYDQRVIYFFKESLGTE